MEEAVEICIPTVQQTSIEASINENDQSFSIPKSRSPRFHEQISIRSLDSFKSHFKTFDEKPKSRFGEPEIQDSEESGTQMNIKPQIRISRFSTFNKQSSDDELDNIELEESISKELEQSISNVIDNLEYLSPNCCIYKVPQRERDGGNVNSRDYVPQEVSIGPYHYDKAELKEMEDHKTRYLVEFLDLSSKTMGDLIKRIEKQETRLRNCYAEPIELDKEKFVKMILVDATFVIMLLMNNRFPRLRRSNDRIFNRPGKLRCLRYDLMMLENQIPFFILEDLFMYSKLHEQTNGLSMIDLTHSLFKGRCGSWVTEDILEEQDFSEVEHFLDFLRICQKPRKSKPKTTVYKLALPKLEELYSAGVKFELHPSTNKLDLEFDKGILKIPSFTIGPESATLLKNLQKFENCHCRASEKYVNDYICMIRLLFKDRKDVELLDQYGIIENWWGDNQAVANVFSTIRWTFHNSFFYYADLLEDLNRYYKDPWHKINANLRQNYFNTPWTGISVIAAAFLLILTVIQTVCSILQVV